MTAGDGAQDRANRSLDQWAAHGVEELTEREAEDRAELGEPADSGSASAAQILSGPGSVPGAEQ